MSFFFLTETYSSYWVVQSSAWFTSCRVVWLYKGGARSWPNFILLPAFLVSNPAYLAPYWGCNEINYCSWKMDLMKHAYPLYVLTYKFQFLLSPPTGPSRVCHGCGVEHIGQSICKDLSGSKSYCSFMFKCIFDGVLGAIRNNHGSSIWFLDILTLNSIISLHLKRGNVVKPYSGKHSKNSLQCYLETNPRNYHRPPHLVILFNGNSCNTCFHSLYHYSYFLSNGSGFLTQEWCYRFCRLYTQSTFCCYIE